MLRIPFDKKKKERKESDGWQANIHTRHTHRHIHTDTNTQTHRHRHLFFISLTKSQSRPHNNHTMKMQANTPSYIAETETDLRRGAGLQSELFLVADPKSIRITRPVLTSSNTLLVLRSKWHTRREWQCLMASTTCRKRNFTLPLPHAPARVQQFVQVDRRWF